MKNVFARTSGILPAIAVLAIVIATSLTWIIRPETRPIVYDTPAQFFASWIIFLFLVIGSIVLVRASVHSIRKHLGA